MSIAIVVGIIVLIIFSMYNSLVRMKNRVKQSRSGIDVYLNQRFDLIPNLIECVKGYSQHEKEVFENITRLRAQYVNNNKGDLKQAEILNNNMNKIMAVSERNPDLKASEQFLKLQKSLEKMESQLQAARRIYNNDVTKYNIKISMVPFNIIAKIFRFKEEELFEIEEIKRENIDIDF